MCGIAGFTHERSRVDRNTIVRITASLAHRGPDQQGIFESPHVSLGAVRLKIIDLCGGDQPFATDDGETVIVFNGEIYNHRDLRQELERCGHKFRTQCDTEVVLEAFREWDTDCFSHLRGMFAIAVWSESRQRLVLARDRLGIKPLYFAQRLGNLYFGSELKAILEHAEFPRCLDLQTLEVYLALNYTPRHHTLIMGIEKLPPGHWLEWRSCAVRKQAYWSLVFNPRSWSIGAAKEYLDELLKDALREHMAADVPLGIWCSGGLDSSTILHYAASITHGRLKTFSVAFPGNSGVDESRYFREVASAYGTEHHEYEMHPSTEVQSAIEEFAWFSDEPCADAGALPVWFLSRMCRENVTVALSGDGADELFGGYLTYLADQWARPMRHVPKFLRRLALGALMRYCPISEKRLSREYMLKRWIEGSFLPPDEAHFYWNGACSATQRRALLVNKAALGDQDLSRDLPVPSSIGYLNRYLFIDQMCYLPGDILQKVDRMSMAHALEVRPPFLDHRIVEFAASLPEDFKIRGMQQKYLLRELMRGKLSRLVLERKKTGFDIPVHEWFRGFLRPLLFETLSPAEIQSSGVFDTAAVGQLIRAHLERRVNVGYQLWGLVTLLLWMKRWGIEAPPQADPMSALRQE